MGHALVPYIVNDLHYHHHHHQALLQWQHHDWWSLENVLGCPSQTGSISMLLVRMLGLALNFVDNCSTHFATHYAYISYDDSFNRDL
jgi:hypothetical protein